MYIEELKGEEEEEGVVDSGGEEKELDQLVGNCIRKEIVVLHAKMALVGAGARLLFYPTLLYNVVRNKIQSEFRWWDEVDQFVLLGAVPFPTDVPRLKQLGVCGVVTLNEAYETLVPTSLYHAHDIEHLVIPTRDYLFAPSYSDICQAVDFINKNTSSGKTTYVHCKAGRGRSTTIVLCYLVQHRQMTPDAAYEYVKSIRPRVLLAPAQRQAVEEFYSLTVKSTTRSSQPSITLRTSDEVSVHSLISHTPNNVEAFDNNSELVVKGVDSTHFIFKTPDSCTRQDIAAFDESSVVLITEADLDGYDGSHESDIVGNEICAEVSIVYRVQFASQAVLARLSGLGLRFIYARHKMSGEKLGRGSSCSVGADKLGGLGVDIHVY